MLLISRRLPIVALFAAGCLLTPHESSAARTKCFPREGHCVAVAVNGQRTVPLTRPTKKALKAYEEVSHYADDTGYEVPEPIVGELDVAASMVAGAESVLGANAQADVQIVPLEAVEIETEQHLVAEPSVRIGGQAAVVVANVLQSNTLPPGKYLLRVKLRGSKNWDRQTIFFTVREDAAP